MGWPSRTLWGWVASGRRWVAGRWSTRHWVRLINPTSQKKKMGRANGLRDCSPSDLCCTRRGLYLPEAATPCPASALLLPCLLPAAITCHGTCWAYLEPVAVTVVARRVVGQEEGGGSRRVRSATSLSRLSSHHVPRSDWPRAWELDSLDSLDKAPQTQISSP